MHKTLALPSHCVNKFEFDIFMYRDRDRITSDSITLKSTRTKIQQSALFNTFFHLDCWEHKILTLCQGTDHFEEVCSPSLGGGQLLSTTGRNAGLFLPANMSSHVTSAPPEEVSFLNNLFYTVRADQSNLWLRVSWGPKSKETVHHGAL